MVAARVEAGDSEGLGSAEVVCGDVVWGHSGEFRRRANDSGAASIDSAFAGIDDPGTATPGTAARDLRSAGTSGSDEGKPDDAKRNRGGPEATERRGAKAAGRE